ncbi:hypothetical protein SEA_PHRAPPUCCINO_186 [Mycobacterium phage Phrappuccino]|uniref:Uncharacterized protein n=1 Tax=Mycobacterium phage Phrappuccino TaxID=2591223 RepID=A0A514DE13_9CAUD|nr:hypothetical protein KHQ87_gp186 [Mycobacterium phage Phrappuccino]QDH91861.1 hypothetical protein SEA_PHRAPPUCCINO_186 [Mycobacterium phage Phrappuccino]QIQ63327.1 hypothetical protein SEA_SETTECANDELA_211 [Mycobacterium phage Settecandela]
MTECCASGSCEVCRGPSGYSSERREQIRRDLADYDPPWVREHRREGWT